MAIDDRYEEAAALTTSLDLPQETALPARRKRNHSLIPKELMNPAEGGMERAALATVFGVREYTEPKVFWERPLFSVVDGQDVHLSPPSSPLLDTTYTTLASDVSQGYVSITNKSTISNSLANKSLPPTPQQQMEQRLDSSQQSIASYVDSVLETVGHHHFRTTMPSNTKTSHNGFALPDIPVVSKFDNWLTTSSSSTTTASTTAVNAATYSIAHDNNDNDNNSNSIPSTHYQQQQYYGNDTTHKLMDLEVAPPIVFLSYPPAIFDLLKSDSDDRIIIWGPDPQVISASEATTTKTATTSTPLSTSHYTKQHSNEPHRRTNIGFSSNATATATTATTAATTVSSIHSDKKKSKTSRWLNKIKNPSSSPALASSSSSSYSEKNGFSSSPMNSKQKSKQKIALQTPFRRRSLKRNERPLSLTITPTSSNSIALAPKVIEAATVEKLVEKLTVTLDYTFMTDFFLTYRTFISPTQLCKLLILRFRWGLENNEDDRCIVRIRTFVVIRHWLLNYFVHDFTPSRELREILTMFLNTLPSHPLIKQSPRDQRIVKGLKRVIRRLKKVHYPASSQHVQVISPPPPLYDEERMRNMIHAKLSQSPLRRKTEGLMQKGMAVEDRHHGNIAFQDARRADIVVIGSTNKSRLPPSTSLHTVDHDSNSNQHHHQKHPQPDDHATSLPTSTFVPSTATSTATATTTSIAGSAKTPSITTIQSSRHPHNRRNRNVSQNSIAKYASSAFSIGRHHQQEIQRAKVKESYLRRMEQQKRMMQQQLSAIATNEITDHHSEKSSVRSDASLESLVTPGTTDDELYDDEDSEEDHSDDHDNHGHENEIHHGQDNSGNQHEDQRTLFVEQQKQSTVPTSINPGTKQVSGKASSQHRRSVYNAELSDLSPLVSPNGSVIHGLSSYSSAGSAPWNSQSPAAATYQYNPTSTLTTVTPSNKILPTPLRLETNVMVNDKVQSNDVKRSPSQRDLGDDQRRVSWSNRLPKSLVDNPEEKTALESPIHEDKVLMEMDSPTSPPPVLSDISSVNNHNLSHQQQQQPQRSQQSQQSQQPQQPQQPQREEQVSKPVMTPQRRLSRRLIKALRSASQSRSFTRATVVQPMVTSSSTATSFVSHSSIPTRQRMNDHVNEVAWDNEHHSNQPNHHLDELRTSLDEILPPPLPPPPPSAGTGAATAASHPLAQRSRVIELDIPHWGPDSVPTSISIPSLFRHSMILQYRSDEMAQQLCLAERHVLLQVNWEEMVHCHWTKMGNHSHITDEDDLRKTEFYDADDYHQHHQQQHHHHHHATYYSRQTRQIQLMRGEQEGGVQQLIKRFNMVCQWVSSEIVRTSSLDDRVLVIEKFIRLAQKCQLYSNFATLVQILLGLQSPSVSRLRKTWARVSDSEMRLLEQLSSFTSPMKNWKHIRDNMTVVAEEYGMSPKEVQIQLPGSIDRQLNKPKIKLPFGGCIPFLGLYLSDLVFNSEQPSYLEPSHEHHKIYQAYTKTSTNVSPLLRQPLVNFRKHRIIATIIKRVLTFQNLATRYSFEQLDPLYTACIHLEALDTETIRQLSMTIEPPPLSS